MTDEALCARWQAGDTRAGDELARRHTRLVRHLGRTLHPPGLDPEDGEAAAFDAHAHALRNYRPGYGCRLVSFIDCVVRRTMAEARRVSSVHWKPTFPLLLEDVASDESSSAADVLDDIRSELATRDDMDAMVFFDRRRAGMGWSEARISAGLTNHASFKAWGRICTAGGVDMESRRKREKAKRESYERPIWSTSNPRSAFAERCATGHHNSGRSLHPLEVSSEGEKRA